MDNFARFSVKDEGNGRIRAEKGKDCAGIEDFAAVYEMGNDVFHVWHFLVICSDQVVSLTDKYSIAYRVQYIKMAE